MPRILLTAFEPYENWSENSSWLTLVELTRWIDAHAQVVTRRYPVDFVEVSRRLSDDLTDEIDCTIHLGQYPGCTAVQLEAIALNVDSHGRALIAGGPAGLRTVLPLERWRDRVRKRGIPARISWHAGTYLCNATFYLAMHRFLQTGRPLRSVFLHLPLAPAQVAVHDPPLASMSIPMMAAAVAEVLEDIAADGAAEVA